MGDLVLIGNIFMKKYYVVYDMSPLEQDKDYIQVGIGLQNDQFLAGGQHYNATSPIFAPEERSLDSSSPMVGTPDVYEDPEYLRRVRGEEEHPDGWTPAPDVDT